MTTRPAGSPPTVTSKKTLDVGVVSGGTSCAGRRGIKHPRGREWKRTASVSRTSDFSKKSQVAEVAFASVTTTTRCPPRVSTSQRESSRFTVAHSASSMTSGCE